MHRVGEAHRRTAILLPIGALATFLLVAVRPATAQVATPVPVPDLTQPVPAPEKQSVGERPRPEYDPEPIRLGSFLVLPSIDVGERFDSNIFGSATHELSDFITFGRPTVSITSDWGGDDAIALYGSGDVEQFARHTSENVGNVTLEADGRLDILGGEYFELRTGYQVLHESRFAPDSQAAVQLASGGLFARFPTEYDVTLGTLSYVRSRGRLGFAVDAAVQAYSFSNEPTLNGRLAINGDRNRNLYTITPRLSYEIEPGYQAFVQVSGGRTQYDSTTDATPEHLKRSSDGYTVAAGSEVNLSDIVTGTLYVGYLANQYDDSRLPSINGPYFAGSLLWNVTPLTSVTVKGSRTIEETILIGSPGAWLTQVDVGVEHELLYSLLLTGDALYTKTDYQGIGRSDDFYGISAGAKWRLNRYFSVGVQGAWQQRVSTTPGNGLDDETISIDFKVAL